MGCLSIGTTRVPVIACEQMVLHTRCARVVFRRIMFCGGLLRQHRPHHLIDIGVWKGEEVVTMLQRHGKRLHANKHTNASCTHCGEIMLMSCLFSAKKVLRDRFILTTILVYIRWDIKYKRGSASSGSYLKIITLKTESIQKQWQLLNHIYFLRNA